MKNKLLLTASLSGIACLSVIMAGSLLSKNQSFNPVNSAESEYTVTFNKDTIAPFSCSSYRHDGIYDRKVAYAQLQNPGNYAAIRDYSYYSDPIFGGEHLYTRSINDSNKRISLNVDINYIENYSNHYYDKELTQKIYVPGYKNLKKIAITFSEQSDIPFNPNAFNNPGEIKRSGNTYTIFPKTNFASSETEVDIIRISESTSSHVNKTIIIDQIVVTYTC